MRYLTVRRSRTDQRHGAGVLGQCADRMIGARSGSPDHAPSGQSVASRVSEDRRRGMRLNRHSVRHRCRTHPAALGHASAAQRRLSDGAVDLTALGVGAGSGMPGLTSWLNRCSLDGERDLEQDDEVSADRQTPQQYRWPSGGASSDADASRECPPRASRAFGEPRCRTVADGRERGSRWALRLHHRDGWRTPAASCAHDRGLPGRRAGPGALPA
jgi:hypothetical protein